MQVVWARTFIALAVITTVLYGGAGGAAAVGETIVMSPPSSPPMARGDGTGIAERLAHEAFHRIGRDLQIVLVPTERSLLNVNSGVDDGELARVRGGGRPCGTSCRNRQRLEDR